MGLSSSGGQSLAVNSEARTEEDSTGLNGAPQPDRNEVSKRRRGGGVARAVKTLGITGLARQLLWLCVWSFIGGLSQATLLVLVSELAVNSVQNDRGVTLLGIDISRGNALAASIAVLVLYAVSTTIAGLATARLSRRSLEIGRGNMIRAYFQASWAVQSNERLGYIQQLLAVSCENIGNVLLTLASGIQALLSVAALIVAAFVVDPGVAGLVIVFGLVLFVLLRPFNHMAGRASRKLLEETNDLAIGVTGFSRLTRETRVLGVEERAIGHMSDRNHRAATAFQKSRTILQITPVIYQTFALGFVIGGLAFLIHNQGEADAIGAVLLLVLRSLTYSGTVQSTIVALSSFEAYLDQLASDLTRYRDSREGPLEPLSPDHFDIGFDDVSFSYPNRAEALRGVSFKVADGATVGVVGRSGSGKTTLTQLLLGLRKPSRGAVLIGGCPAFDLARRDGWSPVAVVAQEPVLLRDTIAANIAFLRDVSREEIEGAARAAHLHDEIKQLPQGYDTPVGDSDLSGGQRQRLAIARALVGRPRLLILDEPTSALDGRSEMLVRSTLGELRGRMTVVIISHRLAAIEDCDTILVLENGEVGDYGERDEVVDGSAFRRVVATDIAPDGSSDVLAGTFMSQPSTLAW